MAVGIEKQSLEGVPKCRYKDLVFFIFFYFGTIVNFGYYSYLLFGEVKNF